jgi:hypothetical protein
MDRNAEAMPNDTLGHARLETWVSRHAHTQTAASEIFGIPQSVLSRILRRQARPGFDNMIMIAERTNQFVRIEDWARSAA